MSTTGPAELSRGARIWRRTRMGLSIGGIVIAILVLAARSEDGMPIAIGAALLTVGAAWEVVRMGKLAERDLGFALFGPVAGAVFLCVHHVRNAEAGRLAGYGTSLVHEVLLVLALAGIGHAAHRALRTNRMDVPVARIVLGVLLVLAAFLAVDLVAYGSEPFRTALLVALAVGGGLAAFVSSRTRRSDARWALGLALWIALPLTWIWHLWERLGPGPMVGLVVLSKVGDIAAYYGGNAFGKHHPLPKLSPGKTTEGFACSVAAGLVGGGVFAAIGAFPSGLVAGLLAGLAVNVAAQAGDLLESWVKRAVGVKDSSAVFGPSGGVLDVVDSLLLSAPVALLVWPALFQAS